MDVDGDSRSIFSHLPHVMMIIIGMMIITGMMTIIMVAGNGIRATGTTVLTALRMITCCRRLRLLQATGEAL